MLSTGKGALLPKEQKRGCTRCREWKPLSEFRFQKTTGYYSSYCKKCLASLAQENPRRRLFNSSKGNAASNGIEHTIRLDDIPIPKICKYLGIRLDYRCAAERGSLRAWNAPSIDRIDPTRGYVKGNIQVISDLVNRMKQDATIDQLIVFAKGVLEVHGDGE